jgi:hypothetical protein
MTKGHVKVFTIIVFLLTAGVIGALVFLPGDLFSSKTQEIQRTKVVIPQGVGAGAGTEAARSAYGEDIQALRLTLEEDEIPVAVLTQDFNSDSQEQQLIAYRKLHDIDSPIYITFAEFDIKHDSYYRRWNASTAATKPGTLILYSEDLIGDGGICVLVSGMNSAGEQTLTVFRKTYSQDEPFIKIAELLIEGSIAVEEPEFGRRAQGRSLGIITYGRDYSSSNIMDQIEVRYAFNPINGLYEQSRTVKIPGTQIEQMRVRELLNGDPSRFEGFIDGLWYQGDGPDRRYVFFNTVNRELIFYNNNSEELFVWQNTSSARLGILINSWNVSLTKVRRTINVELISLKSIRLRVYQDAYLKSGLNTIWDGSYIRPAAAETVNDNKKALPPINGSYTGIESIITFNRDGSYFIDPLSGRSELSRIGQYMFFVLDGSQLLELRTETVNEGISESSRETYKIKEDDETLILTRIRIGTRGIQDLHEAPVILHSRK